MKYLKLSTLFYLLYLSNSFALDVGISKPIYSNISQNIQGITQSEKYWFISNQYSIYRVPKTTKLVPVNFLPPSLRHYSLIHIPKYLAKLGYNHFGGISIFRNYVLVALERISPMKILFFDQDSLNLEYVYDVPKSFRSLSWVAASDKHIFFSENKLNSKSPLYRLEFDSNKLEKISTKGNLSRVQGGSYSFKTNSIFISSDMGAKRGGIYEFFVDSGKIKSRIGVYYNPGFPAYQELEGLAFYKQGATDMITLLMLDNNYIEDSFHFIHIKNWANDYNVIF